MTLTIALDAGSADPVQAQVGRRTSVVTVITNNESRIPAGVGHAAILRSTNGVGVVAERTVDAVAPSASPRADRHCSAAGSRPRRGCSRAGVADATLQRLGDHPESRSAPRRRRPSSACRQRHQSPLPGLSPLTIAAGRRLVVRSTTTAPTFNEALLVKRHTDVVVERDREPGSRGSAWTRTMAARLAAGARCVVTDRDMGVMSTLLIAVALVVVAVVVALVIRRRQPEPPTQPTWTCPASSTGTTSTGPTPPGCSPCSPRRRCESCEAA